MNVLTINCGSSSMGFKVYQDAGKNTPIILIGGKARNVGTQTQAKASIEWKMNDVAETCEVELPSHAIAAKEVIRILREQHVKVDSIGHRFVHGGVIFNETVRITPKYLEDLRSCFFLAPIHNPNSYSVLEECLMAYPGIPQFAVFDTAFHAGMSIAARTYAIPRKLVDQFGFQKFGFHGLSYQYISRQAANYLKISIEKVGLIMCHLGTGGSSITAFKNGRSLDTSMGFSPLPGLVMSTRCGDLDATIVLELIRNGFSPDDVDDLLNYKSGLLGISQYSSNLTEIIEAAEKGNLDCQLAYDVYVNRLETYLGGFLWKLGKPDAIIFTDDIGLSAWQLRERVCEKGREFGIKLDLLRNRNIQVDKINCVNDPLSCIQILVMPTEEELVIYEEVNRNLLIVN